MERKCLPHAHRFEPTVSFIDSAAACLAGTTGRAMFSLAPARQGRLRPTDSAVACLAGTTLDSLRSPNEFPHSDSGFVYGLSRCLSRGNNTASLMFSNPSIVITSRSTPSPHPACGGIPYLNILV